MKHEEPQNNINFEDFSSTHKIPLPEMVIKINGRKLLHPSSHPFIFDFNVHLHAERVGVERCYQNDRGECKMVIKFHERVAIRDKLRLKPQNEVGMEKVFHLVEIFIRLFFIIYFE